MRCASAPRSIREALQPEIRLLQGAKEKHQPAAHVNCAVCIVFYFLKSRANLGASFTASQLSSLAKFSKLGQGSFLSVEKVESSNFVLIPM
jgi:hypothetical protein